MNKRSVFIIYPPFIQVLGAAGAADVILQRIENQAPHQSAQNITLRKDPASSEAQLCETSSY